MYESTTKITTPSICYQQNGTTYYVPLLTSRNETIGSYRYDASSPSVCVCYNGKTYYGAKSRVVTYDIPPGTYDPETFRNMMSAYMTLTSGNFRRIQNATTVTVNGKTTSLSANDPIYFWSGPISYPGDAILHTFQFCKNYMGIYEPPNINETVGNSNTYFTYYIVYYSRGTTGRYPTVGDTYEDYPITVGSGGIKFV